jgi:light-regulated signal transduction histidine kinase (bacteriophytochrome)
LKQLQPQRKVATHITLDIHASGDPNLLRIALENLLRNAWKFTAAPAHVAAEIEFGVLREGDKPVYFVRDNGAGFDMQYAGKLFGAFQRMHGAQDFEGTGIGLAIVHRIIQRHGGRIWAEAAPEQGATFFFTLS